MLSALRTSPSALLRSAATRPLASPSALRLIAQRRNLSDDARRKIDNVRHYLHPLPLVALTQLTRNPPARRSSRPTRSSSS